MLRLTPMAVVALVIEAAVLAGSIQAQTAATNAASTNAVAAKTMPGLAVGTKAPAFKLVGQDGKEHALADLLLKGKLALVFHRSAEW
jgi:cytochrome oxidase Cu insertion factor (SCO1/SenC/PrrC family)